MGVIGGGLPNGNIGGPLNGGGPLGGGSLGGGGPLGGVFGFGNILACAVLFGLIGDGIHCGGPNGPLLIGPRGNGPRGSTLPKTGRCSPSSDG